MTYTEPPVGAVVIDASEEAWVRTPEGWRYVHDPEVPASWDDLRDEYGPVTFASQAQGHVARAALALAMLPDRRAQDDPMADLRARLEKS